MKYYHYYYCLEEDPFLLTACLPIVHRCRTEEMEKVGRFLCTVDLENNMFR